MCNEFVKILEKTNGGYTLRKYSILSRHFEWFREGICLETYVVYTFIYDLYWTSLSYTCTYPKAKISHAKRNLNTLLFAQLVNISHANYDTDEPLVSASLYSIRPLNSTSLKIFIYFYSSVSRSASLGPNLNVVNIRIIQRSGTYNFKGSK